MSNSQVLLRASSAEGVTASVGLLALRPARLQSRFREDATGLAFALEDEGEVRVHVTSSTRPLSLLPQTEVRIHREGMIGVRFRGSTSSARFGIHFLGKDGPLRWRAAPPDQLTWFDPPEDTTGVAFSVLVGGTGRIQLEAIDVIVPPHQGALALGDELVAQLARTVFPTAATSWPTAVPVEVRDSGQITIAGREFSTADPDWPDATTDERTSQLLIHGFAFADGLLGDPGGDGTLARLLIDWSEAHPPRAHSTTVMAWNDMAVSRRTMAILKTLDRLRFTAQPGVVRTLTEILVGHSEWLAHPRNYLADHDHGLYAATALESAARALQFHPLSRHWLRLARERFRATAESIVDPLEGTVREHSPAYVSAVAELVEERRQDRLQDSLGDQIGEKFDRTLATLTTPNGHLIPWGDTSLDHTSSASRPAGVFAYPRTGWSVSHHLHSLTALTSSFHSFNHKHSDELSFVFYDWNGPVIFEAGLPGYAYGTEERSFAESPEAHSGTLIELDTPEPTRREPFGSGVVEPAQADLWHVMMGWNPGLAGARHHRWVIHHPDLIAVVDLVAGKDVRSVTRLLHVAPDRSVALDDSRVRIGAWVLIPDIGGACETRISPSHHFPTPGTLASHRVVELRDLGPGLRALTLSPTESPLEVVEVGVSGTRGQLVLKLFLNDGRTVRAEATPAAAPRHLHLVMTETAV